MHADEHIRVSSRNKRKKEHGICITTHLVSVSGKKYHRNITVFFQCSDAMIKAIAGEQTSAHKEKISPGILCNSGNFLMLIIRLFVRIDKDGHLLLPFLKKINYFHVFALISDYQRKPKMKTSP